jgi:HEAT repeat protein
MVDVLVKQLRTSPDSRVRLGCAINLMSVESPSVRSAFIEALHDPEEKVVRLACGEVGHRDGPGMKEALISVLNNPSWHARLEACKALILANAANAKVVSALEQMRREPEAAEYDTLIEKFDQREKDLHLEGTLGRMWGRLGTILERARNVAARNR